MVLSSILLATLGACGNAAEDPGPAAGATGVSVTGDGHVVINAYVCRDVISQIQIVGDREGLKETEENKVVGTFTSDKQLKGAVTLDLAAPGDAWTPSAPLELKAGKGYIISAQGTGEDANETVALNLSTDAVAELEPGSIYTTDTEDPDSPALTKNTPAEFERLAKSACSD